MAFGNGGNSLSSSTFFFFISKPNSLILPFCSSKDNELTSATVFLISGIGILMLKEVFRKLAIVTAFYKFFIRHIIYYISCITYHGFDTKVELCVFKHVNFMILGDIVIGIVIFYFFSCTSVKEQAIK